MARRGRRGRHSRRRSHSRRGMSSLRHVKRSLMSNKVWTALASVTGVGAFFAQTTNSDLSYAQSSGYWGKLSGTQKIETIFSWTVSRALSVFGFSYSPFPALAGPVKASLNPGNVLNKFTGAGVLALVYSAMGKYIPLLPWRGRVKKFGKPLLAAGILGGLLDDPAGQVTVGRTSSLSRSGGVLASAGPIYRGGGNAAGISHSSLLNQR